MANEEHLARLRRGVKVWNRWRGAQQEIPLNQLYTAELMGADLHRANLTGVNFSRVCLMQADLRGANLQGADLHSADLQLADLQGANLDGADLREANLHGADLIGANLTRAYLAEANLDGADLRKANFTGAYLGWTALGNVDLHTIRGLETVQHDGPSTIGIDTLYHSEGQIPDVFLRELVFPRTSSPTSNRWLGVPSSSLLFYQLQPYG